MLPSDLNSRRDFGACHTKTFAHNRVRKKFGDVANAPLESGGIVAQTGRARGGSAVKPRKDVVWEPPPARSRLRLNRTAPLTQGALRVTVRVFSAPVVDRIHLQSAAVRRGAI